MCLLGALWVRTWGCVRGIWRGLRGANVYIKHCECGCANVGVRTWGCERGVLCWHVLALVGTFGTCWHLLARFGTFCYIYILCYILFVTCWYLLVIVGTCFVTDCTFLEVARMQFRKIKSETATHAIYLCAWNPVGSTTTLHNFHAHSVSNLVL